MKATVASIVLNTKGFYLGDLKHYFKTLFFSAKNTLCPYHNIRHMLHVFFMCYDALKFYEQKIKDPLKRRELLIAALFHDFDHTGRAGGRDNLNLEYALAGLQKHCLDLDKPSLNRIIQLIKATEYPPRKRTKKATLLEKIICDADLSQALSNEAWIRQVIFGLGAETAQGPQAILKQQEPFLGSLKFKTDWAREKFPDHLIKERIAEANLLLECLE